MATLASIQYLSCCGWIVSGLRLLTQYTDRWTSSYLARSSDDGATLQCSVTVPGLAPVIQLTQLDVDCKRGCQLLLMKFREIF